MCNDTAEQESSGQKKSDLLANAVHTEEISPDK
jgi:hypothetical protein